MVYHHLTFERGGGGGAGGGYGWFEEKISCRLIWRESKMLQGNFLETNILHWKKLSLLAYDAGKKILHRHMSRKKNLGKKKLPKPNHPYLPPPPPPPPPLKSQLFDPLEMWLVKTAFITAHMNQRRDSPFSFSVNKRNRAGN